MSKKGIELAAEIFTLMQQTRIKLIKDIKDHQDLKLGQMLEKGKESMKGDFIKITSGKW